MTNANSTDGIASALRYFAGLASDAEATRAEVLGPLDTIALPDGYAIHKLEGLLPTRNRPRGTFATDVVDDFARAVNEHAAFARTFVDAQEWSADGVLNFSGPGGAQGHCDFIARLKVTPSPEWLALVALHGRKFTQRDLIDFVEDWAHCIPGFGDLSGNSMTAAAAVSAFREVRVQSSKSSVNTTTPLKTEHGVLESIEARDAHKWPATMGWACTPALGLAPIVANVRLFVLTSHDTPTIAARVVAFMALRDQVARAFSMLLQSKLDAAPFAGHFRKGD